MQASTTSSNAPKSPHPSAALIANSAFSPHPNSNDSCPITQWPSANGQTLNSVASNGPSVSEKSPTSLQPLTSTSGRKTPVFSVSTSTTNETGSHVNAPNGSIYPPYYNNNSNVSQLNDPKPPLQNGTCHNIQSYPSSNGSSSFSHNSQSLSTPTSNEEYSSTLPQSQPASTASSTSVTGYSNKSGSDLATLLKSNRPYQPTPSNHETSMTSSHSTSPAESLMSSSNTSSSNDHFLANATTTMHHLSNLTTSMNTSTGTCCPTPKTTTRLLAPLVRSSAILLYL